MASQLMTMSEVSAEWGWPVDTLRYWRQRGEGPPSFRVGRRVQYDRAEIEQWLEEQKTREGRHAAADGTA